MKKLAPAKVSSFNGLLTSVAITLALSGSLGLCAPVLAGPITETQNDTAAQDLSSETVQDVKAVEPVSDEQANAAQKVDPAQVAGNNAADHYDRACVYLREWQLELAEQELKAAIMEVPGTMAAHREYMLVALLRGDFRKFFAEGLMVFGLCEPVAYDTKVATSIVDDGLKLHYRQGLAYAGEGKYDEALAELELARGYRPESAKVARSMAFIYATKGDFKTAENFYNDGFRSEPGEAYGHADLAFILAAHGSAERALEQLTEAVKLQPKVAALHVDLGWMAESGGDLAKAENEFAEAIKLSPKHAALWSHLGKLREKQGKTEAACEAYTEALALDPGLSDAREGLNKLGPAKAGVQPAG